MAGMLARHRPEWWPGFAGIRNFCHFASGITLSNQPLMVSSGYGSHAVAFLAMVLPSPVNGSLTTSTILAIVRMMAWYRQCAASDCIVVEINF
jgi:hypothetical protein